jgi:hypothetical protein
MASDFPPKKNVANIYYISVYKSGVIVANPAISAGDFKYSLDGGTITNLATLPDVYPASGTQVRIQLAQAEMNGDKLNIIAHSAAGVFDDFNILISTALLQMGDAVSSVTNPVTIAAGQLSVKKNTALPAFEFVMNDSTNHQPAPGLTVTAQRAIDGAALASCANSVTETSYGGYKINLAAADLNGTIIRLRFSATGADDLNFTIVTQA